MKKIFKFIAPNGEYVEWGEFDDKNRILTFEVKNFSDYGILIDTERVDLILPENFDLDLKPSIYSVHKMHGFMKVDAPDQSCVDDKCDEPQVLMD